MQRRFRRDFSTLKSAFNRFVFVNKIKEPTSKQNNNSKIIRNLMVSSIYWNVPTNGDKIGGETTIQTRDMYDPQELTGLITCSSSTFILHFRPPIQSHSIPLVLGRIHPSRRRRRRHALWHHRNVRAATMDGANRNSIQGDGQVVSEY